MEEETPTADAPVTWEQVSHDAMMWWAETHKQMCAKPMEGSIRPGIKTAAVVLLALYTSLAWPILPYEGMRFWDTLLFFAGSHFAPQALLAVLHFYLPMYVLALDGCLSGLWMLWGALARPTPFQLAVGRVAAVTMGLAGFVTCRVLRPWVSSVSGRGAWRAWATEAFPDWRHSPCWHHHYMWLVEADMDCGRTAGTKSAVCSSTTGLKCSGNCADPGYCSGGAAAHCHCCSVASKQADGGVKGGTACHTAAGSCFSSSSRPQVTLKFHPLYGI